MTSAEVSHRPGACPACGASVEPDWRHCAACGWNVVVGGAEQAHRGTVVVSDLEGSTALAERLDPETLRVVLDRYFDELGAVLESYGGRTEKRIGDMMVTVFGLGAPGADDARSALAAVAEAQRTLASLNARLAAQWGVELVNRTGVATGEVRYVAAGGTHRVLSGPAMEAAGALEPAAPSFEALVAPATVAEAVAGVVLGPERDWPTRSGTTLRACQLLEAEAPADAPARRSATTDACASCGSARHADGEWCTQCGVPLPRLDRVEDRRRYVTVVFADLRVDGTGGDLDPAAHRAALVEVFDRVRTALERHGGTVEKFIGDAVMAVFGLDRRHEDDATRAVAAALEAQELVTAAAPDLLDRFGAVAEVRIGVNTGPVVAGDPTSDQRLVTGDAVNVAARLEQTARAGAVVVGELTRTLLGAMASSVPLEPLSLKGKSEPVLAHRVWRVEVAAARQDRFDLPLVGRADELAALHRVWSEVVEGARWRRVDLVGEAGIGKSRLFREFADQLGGAAHVVRGACPSYGEGLTFLPVADIVRQLVGVRLGDPSEAVRDALDRVTAAPDVAAVLGSLLGVTDEVAPVGEVFWAVRRLLEQAAADSPLVVVVDGLHHAEPTLIDLLADVVEHGGPVPVLVVGMARPGDDGSEEHPSEAVHLGPLTPAEASSSVRAAVGPDALPDGLVDRMVAASGGVPLFVEQFLAALVDDGRLVRDGATWRLTAAVDTLSVPATTEAVVAGRGDAVPPDERRVLETASVVGAEFPSAGVAALLDVMTVRAEMDSLAGRRLVGPVVADDALVDHRFANLLLRDVAYGGLLKRRRSELHRHYGDWMLGAPGAPGLQEIEELVGFHLEQAYALAQDVGLLDDAVLDAGRRAAVHLGAAGERAFVRGDMPAAANLLGRAAATSPADGGETARLLVLAGDAAFEQGEFDAAAARYDQAEALAESAGAAVRVAHARLARATQTYLLEGGEPSGVLAEVDAVEAVLLEHDDPGGIARCNRLRAYVELTACRWGGVAVAAAAGLDAARRAGDLALERRLLPALAGASLYGPTPVPAALAVCEELLASPTVDRRGAALVGLYSGHLLALDGQFERARDRCARTRSDLRELGWHFDAALVSIHLGPIELLAGRPEVAEAELRADYEALGEMGEHNYVATTACLLAEAVRRQGRSDEAASLARSAVELADPDDLTTQAGWRAVLARVATDAGDLDGALDLAEAALALLAPTDDLVARAEAHLDLADVLRRRGATELARSEALAAHGLFVVKGCGPGVAAADRVLAEVDAGA